MRLNPPPNLLPGASSAGALGLNLDPLVQVCSVSAAPGVISEPPKPIRLTRGSESPEGALAGGRPADLQSLAPSDTPEGAIALSPSKRRRESLGASGKGPSRLQGESNLASSSAPPSPLRSLARERDEQVVETESSGYLRGSATLTRITRPAKFFDRAH